jgi:hypothetical protein
MLPRSIGTIGRESEFREPSAEWKTEEQTTTMVREKVCSVHDEGPDEGDLGTTT